MVCYEVFESVKATISPDFINCIPPDYEKMKLVEEVAEKVGLEVILDYENIIFMGSFESISEGRKCFLNYMETWFQLKDTLRCVSESLENNLSQKSEISFEVLNIGESLETTKNATVSELYIDESCKTGSVIFENTDYIYEPDDSINAEPLHLTQLSITFRSEFDDQTLGNSEPSILDSSLLAQCHIETVVGTEGQVPTANQCNRIGEAFQNGEPTKDVVVDRKRRYEEKLPYKYCDLCSFKTKRQSHFAKHASLHQKISEIHECSECEFKALTASTLRKHQLVHFAAEIFCTQCGYKTHSSKALLKHVNNKHTMSQNSMSVQEKSKKRGNLSKLKTPLKCSSCIYECYTKSRLKRHEMEVHNKERPYMCDTCGYMFKRADTLQQHIQLHGTDPKYLCHCGKQCRSMSHLIQHQGVHSHLRPYLCETCGISFKTRSIQRKHQRNKHKEGS